MIIDHISDTHNQHTKLNLKGGDFLIHSGDCTATGNIQQIASFLSWFEKQPYTYKILVPGNHDWGFERDPSYWKEECKNRNIILLNDSSVELEGIKFWGSPITPEFNNWAFNRYRTLEQAQYRGSPWIKNHWDLIPLDTEVLITHGPSYGILDLLLQGGRVGCEELAKKIDELKSLRLHLFGHIHEQGGYEEKNGILHINGSSLDARYRPIENTPIRIQKNDSIYTIVKNSDEN